MNIAKQRNFLLSEIKINKPNEGLIFYKKYIIHICNKNKINLLKYLQFIRDGQLSSSQPTTETDLDKLFELLYNYDKSHYQKEDNEDISTSDIKEIIDSDVKFYLEETEFNPITTSNLEMERKKIILGKIDYIINILSRYKEFPIFDELMTKGLIPFGYDDGNGNYSKNFSEYDLRNWLGKIDKEIIQKVYVVILNIAATPPNYLYPSGDLFRKKNQKLKEIKVNNPQKLLPPGWKEDIVDDFDIQHGIIRIFSAPMDGWDPEHEDSIHIIKADENEFYIDVNYAFGDTEELEEDYPTLISAIAKSINIMKKISKDWRK